MIGVYRTTHDILTVKVKKSTGVNVPLLQAFGCCLLPDIVFAPKDKVFNSSPFSGIPPEPHTGL